MDSTLTQPDVRMRHKNSNVEWEGMRVIFGAHLCCKPVKPATIVAAAPPQSIIFIFVRQPTMAMMLADASREGTAAERIFNT